FGGQLDPDLAEHEPGVQGWQHPVADPVRNARRIHLDVLQEIAVRQQPAQQGFRHYAARGIGVADHQDSKAWGHDARGPGAPPAGRPTTDPTRTSESKPATRARPKATTTSAKPIGSATRCDGLPET